MRRPSGAVLSIVGAPAENRRGSEDYPLLTGVSAFVLLFAACGGDGELDLTARAITDDALALMVLPQSELGSDYRDFQFSEESGFESNVDAIGDAVDKEDEREDIERFGRVNGCFDSYVSEQALLDEQGALSVLSRVTLYESADGASGNLKDSLEDGRRILGVTHDGVTLEDIKVFDVLDVGDEAIGLALGGSVIDESGQELTLYTTVAAFRKGRLIGQALIVGFDDRDVQAEVTALARKLDERIQAVLRGI